MISAWDVPTVISLRLPGEISLCQNLKTKMILTSLLQKFSGADSYDRWQEIVLTMYVGATEDTAAMAREDKTTSSSKAIIVRVFREYYDPRVLTVRTWSSLHRKSLYCIPSSSRSTTSCGYYYFFCGLRLRPYCSLL